MVASPSDSEAASRKLIEALGGKLHHLFLVFGKCDVICLIEAPEDVCLIAGAAAVAVASAGKVTGSYKSPQGSR